MHNDVPFPSVTLLLTEKFKVRRELIVEGLRCCGGSERERRGNSWVCVL
jgi:hypothetical protein